MILQNLVRAIREQNYYAVVLEFVIVIAGVVIGFQINAWNEARDVSERERDYLDRLHEDITELQTTRDFIVARRNRATERLIEFSDILEGRSEAQPGPQHCMALNDSWIVSNPTVRIAVLDELLYVGALDVFGSGDVRSAISRYLLTSRRAEDANVFSQQSVLILHNVFPESILATTHEGERPPRGLYPHFECDFQALMRDPAFRSAFATNAFAFTVHTRQNTLVDEALSDLHRAVDATLGVTHEAE